MTRPLALVAGWRGAAITHRDICLRLARSERDAGRPHDAARWLRDARLAHRAALLGMLRGGA